MPKEPIFPPGRYGRRREPRKGRRPLLIVLVSLLIIGGVAIAWKLYQQYTLAPYGVDNAQAQIEDTYVIVNFSVRLPEGKGANCTVQARTRDGIVAGRAIIGVPPAPAGQRTRTVTYRLDTTQRPYAVDTPACGPA